MAGEEDSKIKLQSLTPRKEKVLKDYLHLKIRGFQCKIKKKDIKEFFAPLKPDSIRLPPKVKGIAYVGFLCHKEWKKALDKNRSFYGNTNSPVY